MVLAAPSCRPCSAKPTATQLLRSARTLLIDIQREFDRRSRGQLDLEAHQFIAPKGKYLNHIARRVTRQQRIEIGRRRAQSTEGNQHVIG